MPCQEARFERIQKIILGDAMLTVACVKWGAKYPSEFANILHNMVRRNLTVPFKFVCYTDDPKGLHESIEPLLIPPTDTTKGWWHKVSLFKRGLFPKGSRVLYFDLDVVIVKNIDFLLENTAPFVILKGWKTKYTVWNSSVMLFDPEAVHFIHDRFIERPDEIVRTYKGDQDWIYECTKDTASNWPAEKILSFKLHCNAMAYPWINTPFKMIKIPASASRSCPALDSSAAIVCFHGKPDPIDVRDGPYKHWMRAPFVAEHWR